MTTGVLVTIWMISALAGAMVGQSKGRAWLGFALAAILGPIGVLICAVMSKTPKKRAENLGLARDALGLLMVPLRTTRRPPAAPK